MRPYFVALIVAVFFMYDLKAQRGYLENSVDTILSKWNKLNAPGIAVAIVQNGEVIYAQGYGLANIEKGVHIDSLTLDSISFKTIYRSWYLPT
jgi:CubicO group peptidase (beta-lactamase class C family)